MALSAHSTRVPARETLTLSRLRDLFNYAEAAREIVYDDEKSEAIGEISDSLIERIIWAPVKTYRDAWVKLWLVGLAAEREWSADFAARPALKQLEAFIWEARR